ncbi:hypothetical protein COU60_03965 [Candidatus Pacearchaeota archaeon CG10_big_fil_rev_8_21_14_0_10_34_76]|nr:MAG: hypothetical protein COU60_03965 [Candidatus Pacearchaeota archaeon CG10_big_fil_rev_8_21_14_0_10_34_76]
MGGGVDHWKRTREILVGQELDRKGHRRVSDEAIRRAVENNPRASSEYVAKRIERDYKSGNRRCGG